MSAKNTVRVDKTAIVKALMGDHSFILNKVYERKLITGREYRNLKHINGVTVEEHVNQLVDKIIFKGKATCRGFLNLLRTDKEVKGTFPELREMLCLDIKNGGQKDDYLDLK